MKIKFEEYKKLYVASINILMTVFAVFTFWNVWSNKLNILLYMDFKNKGNILIIIVYITLFILFFRSFGAFKIGYYTVSNLLISQFLACVCTHIILCIQIILMVGKVPLIASICLSVLEIFAINWFGIGIITIIFTKLYNKLLPPYRMLLIYGDHPNALKKKVSIRTDKYTISEDIYIGEPLETIKAKILNYDAVILNDIPSKNKNILLKYCFGNGIRTYFVPKISDILVKGATEINLFDTPLFLNKNLGLSLEQRFFKRCMDIFITIIVLTLTSPIMLLTALAIKLEDRGPVFYKQKRCTLNGKEFIVYKFRSMQINAESCGGAQLAKKNDSRITKVGAFIRSIRVDELPQLINILKGDMSFVGPRPERPEFVIKNCKNIPEFEYRMQVKAGLTGYAQVYGKYTTTFLDKLKLDLIYIEKYSILLDIQIILMTLKVLFIKESSEGLERDEV